MPRQATSSIFSSAFPTPPSSAPTPEEHALLSSSPRARDWIRDPRLHFPPAPGKRIFSNIYQDPMTGVYRVLRPNGALAEYTPREGAPEVTGPIVATSREELLEKMGLEMSGCTCRPEQPAPTRTVAQTQGLDLLATVASAADPLPLPAAKSSRTRQQAPGKRSAKRQFQSLNIHRGKVDRVVVAPAETVVSAGRNLPQPSLLVGVLGKRKGGHHDEMVQREMKGLPAKRARRQVMRE